MFTTNQNPEQLARDKIDKLLLDSGWLIQNKPSINLTSGVGIAVREYQTIVGSADYILFVNKKPVGTSNSNLQARLFRKNLAVILPRRGCNY